MSHVAGELVTEALELDGGRKVTAYLPAGSPEAVVFAGDGQTACLPFSFLSNHGLVLLCIAHHPRSRMRDIAATVDITERAAQRIVAELIDHGYVTRTR